MQTTSGSNLSSSDQGKNKSIGRESRFASGTFEMGGIMPEIESFQQSVQRCFEVAKLTDFLPEDIALEAFELLTTNQYDHFAAHALGVSL